MVASNGAFVCRETYNASNLFPIRNDEGEENMDDWDEEKLAEVVSKKHGQEKSNQTDIVSTQFFFEFG